MHRQCSACSLLLLKSGDVAFGACTEFQTQSEARIQLSRTNEYFPGTSERIMMISGTVNQVLTALHLVLAKMNSEKTVLETMLARCARTSFRRLIARMTAWQSRWKAPLWQCPAPALR